MCRGMFNLYDKCDMPCRGLNNSDSDFRGTFDQIQDVINKFCHSHNVILLGDLNASFTREEPSSRDKILRKFCESQQLFLCEDYPVVSIFIHPSDKSQFQIDYILCMGDLRISLVSGDRCTKIRWILWLTFQWNVWYLLLLEGLLVINRRVLKLGGEFFGLSWISTSIEEYSPQN